MEFVNDFNSYDKKPIRPKTNSNLLFSERMKLDKYKKIHEKRNENNKNEKSNSYVPPSKRKDRPKKNFHDYVVCIKNLPMNYSNKDLKELGSEYGNILKTHIVKNKYTGESSGIGFIHYTNENEQEFAIHCLHSTPIGYQVISAEKAIKKIVDNLFIT